MELQARFRAAASRLDTEQAPPQPSKPPDSSLARARINEPFQKFAVSWS